MEPQTKNDFVTLSRRAAIGDVRAQLRLAYLSITLHKGAPAPDEGERLLAAACAHGLPEALLLQAALTVRGVGRAKNIDIAYALVKKAAALGSDAARGQLGVLGADELDKTPWLAPIHLDQIAEAPRIFEVREFIPIHVCNWLIESATKKGMYPATIMTREGTLEKSSARTNSMGGFLELEGDLVVQLVARRLARATSTPIANHEGVNILKYEPGQEYKPHFDFMAPGAPGSEHYSKQLAASGMRVATVLVYLNDAYEGGETHFPRINLKYKGKPGDALIFWSVSEKGEPERNSLHAGTPVLSGEKWLLSQWIWQRSYPLS